MAGKVSPRVYCTYFDSGYLSRGLTLIESLRSNGDDSDMYVLALDNETYEYFFSYPQPGIHCISITALEEFEPRLLSVKSSRSRMEYYFTCTPILIKYVMEKLSSPGSLAIYLDADLYFFADPAHVVKAMDTGDVGIIRHKYSRRLETKLSKYGTYNVGWLGFRDNSNGQTVLNWYANSTLDWCLDKPDGGKYADQGYLDWFPQFAGVIELPSPGFNLAPWNTANFKITDQANSTFVDTSPLVFFHFHGLRRVQNWYVTSQLIYSAPASSALMSLVYTPYVQHLVQIEELVNTRLPAKISIKPRGNGFRGFIGRLRKDVLNLTSIVSRNAVSTRS